MNREKSKLYRKVNTKAKGVHHGFGGDFRDSRNSKRETLQQVKGTMFGTKERGLDYTPLFKFLLSKVGSNWNEVFSEAKSRLDKQEPIFWMVALNSEEKKRLYKSWRIDLFFWLIRRQRWYFTVSEPKSKSS